MGKKDENNASFLEAIINFYSGLIGSVDNLTDSNVKVREDSSSTTYRNKNKTESVVTGYAGMLIFIFILCTLPIALLVGVWHKKFWRNAILAFYLCTGLLMLSSNHLTTGFLYLCFAIIFIKIFHHILKKKGFLNFLAKLIVVILGISYLTASFYKVGDYIKEKKYERYDANQKILLQEKNIKDLKSKGYYHIRNGNGHSTSRDYEGKYCFNLECTSKFEERYRFRVTSQPRISEDGLRIAGTSTKFVKKAVLTLDIGESRFEYSGNAGVYTPGKTDVKKFEKKFTKKGWKILNEEYLKIIDKLDLKSDKYTGKLTIRLVKS